MTYKEKLKAKRSGIWSKWRGDRDAQLKRYTERYPERVKAYKKVWWALKTGKLKKSIYCNYCKIESQLCAHHEDYSKPLNVLWLCQDCHNELHGRLRKDEEIRQR